MHGQGLGLTFHPTNNHTLPTPSPISTKETFSTSSARFLEFFNIVVMQQEVTIYYKVKSSIPVIEIRHRVFFFLREKHLWMNNKQIQDNRPMDAVIIFRGHTKYSNKQTLYVKIEKVMEKLETDEAVTEEQQIILTKLLRYNNYRWTIMNKRHTFTDRNHPSVFIDGLIIVVKKPFLRMARELFALIRLRYPNCLGGGMQLLATGTGDIHGYEGYRAMTIRNNDYHNSTDCITIQGYHSEHRELAIKWGKYPPRKTYLHLRDIDGVYDVVETNKSQKIGKWCIVENALWD